MMELATTLESDLEAIVGSSAIDTSPGNLRQAERTTFHSEQKVRAIVFPRTPLEVAEIVKMCARRGATLYPISRGCNWGLGSKVPLRSHSILCDLSRMNAIEGYDKELGTITVRPGTTFRQVSEYLKQNGNIHFLSVTGGSPDSSVLANTLERGDGLGPMGDRSRYSSSLEVVLGDGRIISTGFANFEDERAIGALTQDALGPSLDGLFLQSNFGIVTRITLWLHPVTEHFASVLFTLPEGEALSRAMNGLRELSAFGIVRGNSLAIWNMQKVIASSGNHPKLGFDDLSQALSQSELQRYLPSFFKGAYWFGTAALYGVSNQHLAAQLKEFRRRVAPHAVKFLPMTRRRAQIYSLMSPFLAKEKKQEMERWLNAFYYRSVYRGNTSELSIRSLYWRKPQGVPSYDVDPNRDACGLVWLCHAVPCRADAIEKAEFITKEISQAHGFDPNVAFLVVSERYVRMFVALMYDRDRIGLDARVMECQRKISDSLVAAGFPPFRLGIQSMDQQTFKEPQYHDTICKLKQVFDPQNLIAPGRYDGSLRQVC